MTTINDVEAKIYSHVDVCAVRYAGIESEMQGVNSRLKRLEAILICGAGSIILGASSIIVLLLQLVAK